MVVYIIMFILLFVNDVVLLANFHEGLQCQWNALAHLFEFNLLVVNIGKIKLCSLISWSWPLQVPFRFQRWSSWDFHVIHMLKSSIFRFLPQFQAYACVQLCKGYTISTLESQCLQIHFQDIPRNMHLLTVLWSCKLFMASRFGIQVQAHRMGTYWED